MQSKYGYDFPDEWDDLRIELYMLGHTDENTHKQELHVVALATIIPRRDGSRSTQVA